MTPGREDAMRAPRFFNTIRTFLGKSLPWLLFICLAAAMLFDPTRNTLGVASAAFAVTLALASVTFSYSRTLKENSRIRDELIFAGERLVCGAVLCLVASILKYASNDLPRYTDALFRALVHWGAHPPDVTLFGYDPIAIIIAFAAFMIFLIALIYAQQGIVMLVSIAGHRAKRRPDYERFFIAPDVYERHLAELEERDKAGSPTNL
jgi:hypothetical protein